MAFEVLPTRPGKPQEKWAMKRSRYSDEQISYALKQAEGGTAVADVWRQLGISETTFYIWKKKYANLGVHLTQIVALRGGSEVRELREE
jgi:transposase-like protein